MKDNTINNETKVITNTEAHTPITEEVLINAIEKSLKKNEEALKILAKR